MPFVKEEERSVFDPILKDLASKLAPIENKQPVLSYIFTKMLLDCYGDMDKVLAMFHMVSVLEITKTVLSTSYSQAVEQEILFRRWFEPNWSRDKKVKSALKE